MFGRERRRIVVTAERVQQVDAVLSALTIAAMFMVVYALVGSWALAVAAALLFVIRLRYYDTTTGNKHVIIEFKRAGPAPT